MLKVVQDIENNKKKDLKQNQRVLQRKSMVIDIKNTTNRKNRLKIAKNCEPRRWQKLSRI